MSTPLRELPIDERIRLVEDLWDSIARLADRAGAGPENHKRELDARLRAFELDDELSDDANTVIERIRKAL